MPARVILGRAKDGRAWIVGGAIATHTPAQSTPCIAQEDQGSMLRPRLATRVRPGLGDPRAPRPSDRAMDVLQYGAAFLALAGAVILALLR
jgi:hypothetical protein